MTTNPGCTFHSDGPDATRALAQRLAPILRPSDVILLDGEVGAGKTHFARSLIQSLMTFAEDVPSPTYTLIQTYPADRAEIWHADLYRLTDANEIVELGLIDAFDDAICLIEWPDRLGDLAPKGALSMTFAHAEAPMERVVTFAWQDAKWTERSKAMQYE